MGDLNDILNGSEGTETETETETVETTEQETEQPEQEAAQEETETGVETSQAAAETETAAEPEEVKGLKAAAAAERKKRQEEQAAYQQELAALRQQLAQIQKPQEEEKPFLGEEYEQRFTETEQKLKEEVIQTKIMLSRDYAMDKYADYEAKEAEFIQMARANPALIDQMRASANPAAFAYKTVSDLQQIQKLKELGDPVAYATKLEQELREKIKAELKAEQEAEKKAATEAAIRAKLPRTGFAEERSTGTARATTKTFDGPTPLKSILG